MNGELRHDASTSDMILNGTPSGVGMGSDPPRRLRPGVTVSLAIEGIGMLSNPVVAGG